MEYKLLAMAALSCGVTVSSNLHAYDIWSDSALSPTSEQIDSFNTTLQLVKIIEGQYSLLGSNNNNSSEPASVNVKEIVELLKSVYGLNIVQIANVVGVSRPSIYNHISGKEVPQSFESYQRFYDLANRVQAEVKGISLKQGMKSVLVNGSTLLHRLKEKNINEAEFVAAAQIVAEKLSNRTEVIRSNKEQIATAREYIKAG